MFGLRLMSLEDPHIPQILTVLTKHMTRCREPLTAQAVGNTLYSMRNKWNIDQPEVRHLLVVLSRMVANSASTLDTSRIGYPEPQLAFSLQKLAEDFPEVQDMLVFLNVAAGREVCRLGSSGSVRMRQSQSAGDDGSKQNAP